jgi:hypothetical protein
MLEMLIHGVMLKQLNVKENKMVDEDGKEIIKVEVFKIPIEDYFKCFMALTIGIIVEGGLIYYVDFLKGPF